MSSLLPINCPQPPSTRAHTQSRHSLHWAVLPPSLSLHPPQSSLLSLRRPPWQHQAQGATSQLGEGRESRGGKAKAGEKRTRLAPSFWNHHPRVKGKWARLGGPQRCGLPGDGSSRRLFSRRFREATQVSTNDLTHCKRGTIERLG